MYCHLHQGGYVIIGVCLFVSRIVQKPFNRFSQNSVEGCTKATEEPLDFGGNLNHVTLGLRWGEGRVIPTTLGEFLPGVYFTV